MERGEPIWQTRSTVPISMPSSSEAVATTARSSPLFQAALGFEAQLAREAAVVRQDGVFAEALREMMRHALGQAARVDEDKRGAVLADELGDAVVDLAPHFVGGDGAELVARDFDGQFHRAAVADVDDRGVVAQERGDILDGLDGGGEADALGLGQPALFDETVEAREREGEVRAALIVGDGVDLVDDQRADLGEHLARLRGGQQDEERLGRGDQDVGRWRVICWRSHCGVSPVRRAVRMGASGMPRASARARISASGISRFLWTSLLSALSGET